tara:strand:+ start:123 stop:1010 length:888 start_codon:yes stop_codon:yes gene_type:complete
MSDAEEDYDDEDAEEDEDDEDDAWFPDEEVAPECQQIAQMTAQMERLRKEQEAEQEGERAKREEHEARERQAAAAAAQRVAEERRVARKHKCLVDRIDVAKLQAACRSHGEEVHDVNNAQGIARFRDVFHNCVRFGYDDYCRNVRRFDWTTSDGLDPYDGLDPSPESDAEDAEDEDFLKVAAWRKEGPGEAWRPVVNMPEVFVVQLCVALMGMASRSTPWQRQHRLLLLSKMHLVASIDGYGPAAASVGVLAEAHELLLTLERLRRTHGLLPEITQLILAQLPNVEPPTQQWRIQ